MTKIPIQLLITDLDNTVYDWVSFYANATAALVREAERLLDVPADEILDDLRAVHQRFGTMERPYALLDTDVVVRCLPRRTRRERATHLDAAFHAFDEARSHALRMNPGALETLETLSGNCVVVAHTESSAFNATLRLELTGLSRLFRRVYASADQNIAHPFPERIREVPELAEKMKLLLPLKRKPDPEIVLSICKEFGVKPDRCAYVGDSLQRDMVMAKQAGVCAVWARYGTEHSADHWRHVLRVSYWTADDVRRDELSRRALETMKPDAVIDRFSDLVDIFSFSAAPVLTPT